MSFRAVGVIPARWASTRLPGKSLHPICGKPLVLWVVEAAERAELLDEVVVATDDERIADVVDAGGHKAVMTRKDHPSGTDRVAETVCTTAADVIVNIQGDEPLMDPCLIDRIVKRMREDSYWDMATAATPIENDEELHDSSVVKVVWGEKNRALYFSRSVIPFVRDPDTEANVKHWRHLGIYAYRDSFLKKLVESKPCDIEEAEKLEQLRALYMGASMVVIETNDKGIGVDTPQDVERVERLMSREQGAGRGINPTDSLRRPTDGEGILSHVTTGLRMKK